MKLDRQMTILALLLILLIGCTKTEIISEQISGEEKIEQQVSSESTSSVSVSEGKIATSCSDTDAGLDSTSRGIITGKWEDGTTFENEDDCFGGVYLVEYYCENNQPKSRNFRCENGCKKGVCI